MNKRIWIIGLVILIVSCGVLSSCKMSTGKLAKEVQKNMVETWKENGIDMRVTKDLLLVKKSNSEYSGLMTISAFGETEQITVNVIYDGESFSWKVEGY